MFPSYNRKKNHAGLQWDAKGIPQRFFLIRSDDNSPSTRHSERISFYSVIYMCIFYHSFFAFSIVILKNIRKFDD